MRGVELSNPSASLDDLLSAADVLEADYSAADDDKHGDRKKKVIKKIVSAVLSYHVVPHPLPLSAILDNTTYATNLTIGHGFLDGEASRIRVANRFLGFGITVNIFSRVIGFPVAATNGQYI